MIDLENLNPFTNPIIIKCKGADTLPLDKLLKFQGDLKKLTSKNRDKLVKSICKLGFIAPVFIWRRENDNYLLDGAQRRSVLFYMRNEGWDVPDIPVVYIEADNEKDAREKLLHITSSYGEFELTELGDWLQDFDAEIAESIRLVDKELAIDLTPKIGEEEEEESEKGQGNIILCPHCGEIITPEDLKDADRR